MSERRATSRNEYPLGLVPLVQASATAALTAMSITSVARFPPTVIMTLSFLLELISAMLPRTRTQACREMKEQSALL